MSTGSDFKVLTCPDTGVTSIAGSNEMSVVVDEVERVDALSTPSQLRRSDAMNPLTSEEGEDLYHTCTDAELMKWLTDNGFGDFSDEGDMMRVLQDVREDMLNTLEKLEDKLESLMPCPPYPASAYAEANRMNKRAKN